MARTDNGVRSMVRAVGGVAGGLWGFGDGPDDDQRLPRHYPATTVVVATALCVLVSAAFGGLRMLVATLTGFQAVLAGLWVLSALVMFLPVAVAFFVGPARRVSGLLAGGAAGVVAGVVVGTALAGWSDRWSVFAGVAAAALVLALVFGSLTRDPAVP